MLESAGQFWWRRHRFPVPSMDPVDDYHSGQITITEATRRMVEIHNGISAREIGDAFGLPWQERNAISRALARHVMLCGIRVEGEGMKRIYYPIRRRSRGR